MEVQACLAAGEGEAEAEAACVLGVSVGIISSVQQQLMTARSPLKIMQSMSMDIYEIAVKHCPLSAIVNRFYFCHSLTLISAVLRIHAIHAPFQLFSTALDVQINANSSQRAATADTT